jgi:hypothetical protein
MAQLLYSFRRLFSFAVSLLAFLSTASLSSAQTVQVTVAPLVFGTPLLGYQALLQATYKRATDSLAAVYHYQPATATYHYRLATSFEKGSDPLTFFPNFQHKAVFGLCAADKLVVQYTVEIKNLDAFCQHPSKLLAFFGQVYSPVFQQFAGAPATSTPPAQSWSLSYQGATGQPITQLRQVVADVFASTPLSLGNASTATPSTTTPPAVSILLQAQPQGTHISVGFPDAAAVTTRCGAPLKTEFDASPADITGGDLSFLFAKMKQSAYEYAVNR